MSFSATDGEGVPVTVLSCNSHKTFFKLLVSFDKVRDEDDFICRLERRGILAIKC